MSNHLCRFCVRAIVSLAAVALAAAAMVAADYDPVVRVTTLLRTTTTAAGAPIAFPATTRPEVSAHLVEIPPGAETGWHQHPFPVYAYMLEGTIAVDLEGGVTHEYKPGAALVEAVNLPHNGRNIGAVTAKLVIFVTGEQGLPFTVRRPPPATP